VSIKTLTLGDSVLSAKAMDAMTLPAIHTTRHPYLLVKALTIGPAQKIIIVKKIKIIGKSI